MLCGANQTDPLQGDLWLDRERHAGADRLVEAPGEDGRFVHSQADRVSEEPAAAHKARAERGVNAGAQLAIYLGWHRTGAQHGGSLVLEEYTLFARGTDQLALWMLGEGTVEKHNAFIRMVAPIAVRYVKQHNIALAQAPLGGADGFHGDTGAGRTGGAVQTAAGQTVFTEAGYAEHIVCNRLVEAGNTHRTSLEQNRADLAAQPRLANAIPQQDGGDLLQREAVQGAGLAHAVQLIGAFDGPQACEDAVHWLRLRKG